MFVNRLSIFLLMIYANARVTKHPFAMMFLFIAFLDMIDCFEPSLLLRLVALVLLIFFAVLTYEKYKKLRREKGLDVRPKSKPEFSHPMIAMFCLIFILFESALLLLWIDHLTPPFGRSQIPFLNFLKSSSKFFEFWGFGLGCIAMVIIASWTLFHREERMKINLAYRFNEKSAYSRLIEGGFVVTVVFLLRRFCIQTGFLVNIFGKY